MDDAQERPSPATRLERPFFILGSGRSGTSLLSRMLNRHPNLAVPPESHLYNVFWPWRRYYGNLAARRNQSNLISDMLASGPLQDWTPRLTADEILARIDGDDFGAVVGAVMAAWAAREGKRRWGEKTPQHARYWRQISTDFAGSPLIHMVRDGRDVAISMIAARFGPKSVYGCARAWKQYLADIERIRGGLPNHLFLEVRYEELLDDTEGSLARVCAFLGEPYAPEMLSFYRDASPYPTDARNQENLARPVLTANKEKWRDQMTQEEIRMFEAVASDALARYGYPCVLDHPVLPKGQEWYRRHVEAPYRRSIGRLRDRKGQRERVIQLALLARRAVMRPFVD